MGLSTLFSDSKIASQIGSLALIIPLAVYQLLLNFSESGRSYREYNYDYLYIGYPLPFVPMSVIITYALGGSLGTQSIAAAWAALILSLPAYYLLYIYLDQVVPNTFGISKSCCFCFKKRRTAVDGMRDTFKNSNIQ
jgi:hypothetical protein